MKTTTRANGTGRQAPSDDDTGDDDDARTALEAAASRAISSNEWRGRPRDSVRPVPPMKTAGRPDDELHSAWDAAAVEPACTVTPLSLQPVDQQSYYNNVSYRKPIARQHSCHRKKLARAGVVFDLVNIFLYSLF